MLLCKKIFNREASRHPSNSLSPSPSCQCLPGRNTSQLWLLPEGQDPDCLVLIANGTFHSQVLEGWSKQSHSSWGVQEYSLVATPRPSKRGQAKTSISHFLPGRGFTTCFPSCCLRIISNQPASRCQTWYFPLVRWQVLAYLWLLWATKNKEGILNSNQGFRDNQKLKLGWLTRLVSHGRPFCQEEERRFLFLMLETSTESKEMEKQRSILQTKEQDRCPETDLNETDRSG